jgi:hypothetical protein
VCLALFLATDRPLPRIEYVEGITRLSVHDIAESDRRVKDKISKSYIAYVGAWEGCGCGFEYGLLEDPDEEDHREDELGKESVRELRGLLEMLLQEQEEVELYVCMDGEQDVLQESRIEITPTFFLGDSLELEPGTLFVVRPAA